RGASNARLITNSWLAASAPPPRGSSRWTMSPPSRRLFAVDHPWRPEPVDQHAEALGPERRLDRHPDRPALGQGLEDALGVSRIGDTERDREAFHGLVAAGRRIGTHQRLVAHGQPGVHDLVVPFGRHMIRGRRAGMRNHRLDRAAENLRIEPERGLALAAEGEVGIELHRALPDKGVGPCETRNAGCSFRRNDVGAGRARRLLWSLAMPAGRGALAPNGPTARWRRRTLRLLAELGGGAGAVAVFRLRLPRRCCVRGSGAVAGTVVRGRFQFGRPAVNHEFHADLPVLAADHAAAPAERQRDLVRNLEARPHRQPRAVSGDIADDAVDRRRVVVQIDMGQIVHVIARRPARLAFTLSQSEESHGTPSIAVTSLLAAPLPRNATRKLIAGFPHADN